MSRTPTTALRWSVTIRHTSGTQTFVVAADAHSDALAAAWTEAQQPPAIAHRRAATLTDTPGTLRAQPIDDSAQ